MTQVVPFQESAGDRVRCRVCPHNCRIRPGGRGICRVRENRDGTVMALNYAEVAAYALDPTEKKPLFHFFPGSTLLSLGSFGCNFRCGFCQNWTISQQSAPTVSMSPDEAVELALAERVRRRCVGIAFTYSEPLMWYEYVVDTAGAARGRGLETVLVTNGYVNELPRQRLLPVITAMNVDLKAADPGYYRRHCGARLQPVLETISAAHEAGVHVEVTCLLVPRKNDADEDIDRLAALVAGISPGIPLHLNRYFPNYRFSCPATPTETVLRARDRARRQLRFVYAGNLGTDQGGDTACPDCGSAWIVRRGFGVRCVGLRERDSSQGYECENCGRLAEITGQVVSGRY